MRHETTRETESKNRKLEDDNKILLEEQEEREEKIEELTEMNSNLKAEQRAQRELVNILREHIVLIEQRMQE